MEAHPRGDSIRRFLRQVYRARFPTTEEASPRKRRRRPSVFWPEIIREPILYEGTLQSVFTKSGKAFSVSGISNCVSVSFSGERCGWLAVNRRCRASVFFAHVSKADVLKVSDEELQFFAGTMDFDHGVEGVDGLTSVSYVFANAVAANGCDPRVGAVEANPTRKEVEAFLAGRLLGRLTHRSNPFARVLPLARTRSGILIKRPGEIVLP